MDTLGITHSVCEICRSVIPAKIESDGRDVFFLKFCPRHGQQRVFVRSRVDDYLSSQRFVKPAWTPEEFAGDARAACPDGCGSCGRHEQHLCMPIVEITSRCDLDCPVCLVDAGGNWEMAPGDFSALLDTLIRAEKQVDVLNLSGGEPLLHSELLTLVDEALLRPEIVRVSISTNGLALLENPSLLEALHKRNVVISLQFDGFDDKAYEILRGRRLLDEKTRILRLLEEEGISTSLTMTAARGVNDEQFRPILDYVFSHEHIVSLMIQPLAFAGRGAALGRERRRLTIPDVVEALGRSGHPFVSATDFVPLPCSHPLCFSLAFYLMLDGGGAVSVNSLSEADSLLDALSNRVVFGLDPEEHERLKDMLYALWSGPAASAPDSAAVIATVRRIMRQVAKSRYEPRAAFTLAERQVKSIFLHAFQDADTFDLARVRRCCQAYPQPDGSIVSPCVRNVLRRPSCRA